MRRVKMVTGRIGLKSRGPEIRDPRFLSQGAQNQMLRA